MTGEAHFRNVAILQAQIKPNVVAANWVDLFVRDIGRLQRAIVARILIVVENDFAIEVFHTFLLAHCKVCTS